MNWLQKIAYPNLPESAMHGTCEDFASKIKASGFEVSTSGGGGRGLKGVWLTQDINTANIYSSGWAYKLALPCVLNVMIKPGLNIADLTHKHINPSGAGADAFELDYLMIGLNIHKEDDLKKIRALQPFALTKLLIQNGYDGAWISNTLHPRVSTPELVIFDPANLRIDTNIKKASNFYHPNVEKMISYWENRYAVASGQVSGLTVDESDIPNLSSVSSSLEDWYEIRGIREIPIADFSAPENIFYSKNDFKRSKDLSEQIQSSKTIVPLIIVVDKDFSGPYILEGVHRYAALYYLGVKSFPAVVFVDLTNEQQWDGSQQKHVPVPEQWNKIEVPTPNTKMSQVYPYKMDGVVDCRIIQPTGGGKLLIETKDRKVFEIFESSFRRRIKHTPKSNMSFPKDRLCPGCGNLNSDDSCSSCGQETVF